MREQHSSKLVEAQVTEKAEEHEKSQEPDLAEPEKEFGVVAVCAGEGLVSLFKELGADGVVSGGQTMNPATEDILRQINKTPANTVFVLPNNSNIKMAAEQCALLTTKRVIVIKTTTVQQGVAAMLALEFDKPAEENEKAMTAAIKGVTSISITYAARDSVFDGAEIKAGDFLVLQENKLLCSEAQLPPVIESIAQSLRSLNSEILSVFYGVDVDEAQARELVKSLEEALPEAEISLVNGGQPVYYYLISAE
jgi:dihydroxyacetone kinase-like predicted kinase